MAGHFLFHPHPEAVVSAPARLRAHSHREVKVLAEHALLTVTARKCTIATRGGEQERGGRD